MLSKSAYLFHIKTIVFDKNNKYSLNSQHRMKTKLILRRKCENNFFRTQRNCRLILYLRKESKENQFDIQLKAFCMNNRILNAYLIGQVAFQVHKF